METSQDKGKEIEKVPRRRTSVDILLCHNCGWNAELQVHNCYVSTVKCFFSHGDRGIWELGEKYILKQRGLIGPHWEEDFMGPDVATTNWLHKNTTLPVAAEMHEWKDSKNRFILMSKLPGRTLEAAWPELTDEEKRHYAEEVGEYLAQLRTHTAPKPQTVEGDPVRDILHNVMQKPLMLIEDREEWWASVEKYLMKNRPNWRDLKSEYPEHKPPYVLTHGDLNTGNITIHDGHISGILDWEYAGYYPEWWEFAAGWNVIEEHQWNYYLTQEMSKRFGSFIKEARFVDKFRCSYNPSLVFKEFGIKNEDLNFPPQRDYFCECKPIRNLESIPSSVLESLLNKAT